MEGQIGPDSSIDEMRNYIKQHGLNITTAGPGRNKAAIWQDICQEAEIIGSFHTLSLNEQRAPRKAPPSAPPSQVGPESTMQELRLYIKSHGLDIPTAGAGRDKETVLAQIQWCIAQGASKPPEAAQRRPPILGHAKRRDDADRGVDDDALLELAVPPNWTATGGWPALIDVSGDSGTTAALQGLLNGTYVGCGGRDASGGPRYARLALAGAWRVENPDLWRAFAVARRRARVALPPPPVRLRPAHFRAAAALPGPPLPPRTNELRLLHGTRADRLPSLLQNGFNERYAGAAAGAAFGGGVYLADDAGKADHYARPDPIRPGDPLHAQLFPGAGGAAAAAPCLLVVVRAALGWALRTCDGATATAPEPGAPVFATAARRELAPIPGLPVPVPHHSLVVEPGPGHERFAEYVVFHGDRLYPEYLVAYTRL